MLMVDSNLRGRPEADKMAGHVPYGTEADVWTVGDNLRLQIRGTGQQITVPSHSAGDESLCFGKLLLSLGPG